MLIVSASPISARPGEPGSGGTDAASHPNPGKETGERQQVQIPETLPILPVRNTVLFPGTLLPMSVGRPNSRKLLEESLPQSKVIGIFTQQNPEQNDPGLQDLHRVGTAAAVLKLL